MNQPNPTQMEEPPKIITRNTEMVDAVFFKKLVMKMGNQAAAVALGYSASAIGQLFNEGVVRTTVELASELIWERHYAEKTSLETAVITATPDALKTISFILANTGGKLHQF